MKLFFKKTKTTPTTIITVVLGVYVPAQFRKNKNI
jgi:hypothetical protein